MSLELSENILSQAVDKAGVYIRTFGCQMNEYDSEKMLALLSSRYQPVASAEEAELVIVNTCSVREKAEHKLYSLLGSLALLKAERPQMVIGVTGCVAQQEGQSILRRSRAVDFVVGTHNLSLVPSLVERARIGGERNAVIDYREEWEELPDEFDSLSEWDVAHNKFSGRQSVRALVAIQRGCDKQCSFCVVPFTRGPQVSRSLAEILKEVRLKVRLGAKEVLLLGQTVNSYGLDLSPRVKFEELIWRLSEIEGLARIRFTSPHPGEFKPGFIELFGKVPQLCPHIHLPLQSGSDRVLKLMNRNYRRERYLEIAAALRERCADLAITTDIIVGFPSETEEDFAQTLEVVRQVGYSMVYSFKYSPRPNTVAEAAFSREQGLSEEVLSERMLRLQQVQEEICLRVNRTWIGKEVEVLVEGVNKKISSSVRGRIPQNTPVELRYSARENGAVLVGAEREREMNRAGVEFGRPLLGALVRARIEHATPYGLRGDLIR